jgi:hypothetical protein
VGDWLCLHCGGKNGFFMVLLNLACWCEAIVNDADRVPFTKTMGDVAWVLSQMVTVGTPSTKWVRNAHNDQDSYTLCKRYVDFFVDRYSLTCSCLASINDSIHHASTIVPTCLSSFIPHHYLPLMINNR